MKIAVLGATGPSGQEVVKQALEAGHEVVAVVRNPDKLQVKHNNLKVEKASIFSEDSLASHFSGCDAVLSCLGAPVSFFTPVTLLQDSCKSIVSAMRKAEVKKFIPMSSQFAKNDTNTPFFMKWVFIPLVIGRQLTDLACMEDFLVKDCQDIEFVVVKPPGLTNEPLDNGSLLAEEGQTLANGKSSIPRANVAHFMLDQLTRDEWHKKLVAIGIKK